MSESEDFVIRNLKEPDCMETHISVLEAQLAALKEQSERLNARVAELEAKDREIFLVASSVAEDVGKGKYQIGYSAACADIVGRFYSKESANEG